MEEESAGGAMEEESWRSDHGGEIGGGIMEE